MQELFKGYKSKQCNTCVFCEKKQQDTKMKCTLFIMPYYVWGEYTHHKNTGSWRKFGNKLSPEKCWGYCDDEGELLRRTQAIKAYAATKKPKKEAV